MSSSETELHANITTRGQLEKDFHRLLVERVTEVIDRFRLSILEALEQVTTEIELTRSDIARVAEQVVNHEQRLAALEAERDTAPVDG